MKLDLWNMYTRMVPVSIVIIATYLYISPTSHLEIIQMSVILPPKCNFSVNYTVNYLELFEWITYAYTYEGKHIQHISNDFVMWLSFHRLEWKYWWSGQENLWLISLKDNWSIFQLPISFSYLCILKVFLISGLIKKTHFLWFYTKIQILCWKELIYLVVRRIIDATYSIICIHAPSGINLN